MNYHKHPGTRLEDMVELSLRTENDLQIITLAGRIDWENASTLDESIRKIIDEGSFAIAFDLNKVKFICSGGIGALVYSLNRVQKKGGSIYIVSDNEYVNFIFETLKFDIVFEGCMYTSFDELFHARKGKK